jgi:cellulose synthase/poly-beta-1,6-N-acetylglucosamine synthase-like glycosyltransferase
MLFKTLELITLAIYTVAILYLFVFSLSQIHLTWAYIKKRKKQSKAEFSSAYKPKVTIQLPLYNEPTVAQRLIEQVAKVRYPLERLEIQILDDSTDDTSDIIKNALLKLPSSLNIKHIQRSNRAGYKAGALKEGLKTAEGELVAIFDADFLLQPDFLEKTVGFFTNENLGVVQTKWGHLNEDYSLLTKTQAFGLDAHFSIEQKGRNIEDCFISFNGTAGIWRKNCIEDAGGWQSDTLTEDLDLSFRAQLKGWKFLFLEDVVSPAELPITVGAYKSQQYRWNKGAAETHIKLWKQVKKSPIPIKIKAHALMQLVKGVGFIASFILTITSVPILYFKSAGTSTNTTMQVLSFTLLCIVALVMFYLASAISHQKSRKGGIVKFIKEFPGFIALSLGTTMHNTVAVIEGYLGIKTPFVRTPKFNITNGKKVIAEGNITWLTFIEGSLAIYFVFGVFLSFKLLDFTFLPFHLLLFVGYGYFFVYSIAQRFNWAK